MAKKRQLSVLSISAQTGYIVAYERELYHIGPGDKKTHHKTMKQ